LEANAKLPKYDVRGQGGVTQEGRPVRPYTGSTRPPHIDPTIWSDIYSAKDKKKAIAEYLKTLESTETSPAKDLPAAPAAPARK
jgi:hypothetical protein